MTAINLSDTNFFAYCRNNPVSFEDTSGQFINTVCGAIAGGIVGAISAAVSGDKILAGAAIGAATGAIGGMCADIAIATGGIGAIAIAAAGGALASGSNYVANTVVNERDVDWGSVVIESTVGAVANVLTFGVGGGTIRKVGGSLMKNMKNSWQASVCAGTTKKLGGKIIQLNKQRWRKAVVTNVVRETTTSTVITTGGWLTSTSYKKLFRTK